MLTRLRPFAFFVLGVALWLPLVHVPFAPPPRADLIRGLSQRQHTLAKEPDSPERALLRRINPEWDLMSRTFAVLAFTNLALAEPLARQQHLAAADALIDRTLVDEQRGPHFFLLPYGRRHPFVDDSQRSLFVDGEVALMLAARQLVEPREALREPLRVHVDQVTLQLLRAPFLFAESYPDEGWTFCNTIALAALRLSDRVDGRDHQQLLEQWLASAKAHLVEPRTGLLISSFRMGGAPLAGPEGSTLWLSAHMLQLIDRPFAEDQYRRARALLGRTMLGFGWAAEWPKVLRSADDVDSGPTVPLVDANAGSSGLALLGASAFHDEPYLEALTTSLATPRATSWAMPCCSSPWCRARCGTWRPHRRPVTRPGDDARRGSHRALLPGAARHRHSALRLGAVRHPRGRTRRALPRVAVCADLLHRGAGGASPGARRRARAPRAKTHRERCRAGLASDPFLLT